MLAWDEAWQHALYGPQGFYLSAAPAAHFRTSVHASPLLAEALARLARACGLGRVIDIGSGRGELLHALADADPDLELIGVDVDVVERPPWLPPRARWVRSPGGAQLPGLGGLASGALVVAHEWLDDVPCPVLEVDGRGRLRVVQVGWDGAEHPGGDPTPVQLAWVHRWWPVDAAVPGDRVEVGLPRDLAWAALVAQAEGSVLLAVDYAHALGSRPTSGTLVGYRRGAVVDPVPDGSCDLTAHVALDAAGAAAADGTQVRSTVLTTQRDALTALGVDAARPQHELAAKDPAAYLAALSRCGQAGELLARDGLGGFGWLVQSRGPQLPAGLGSSTQGHCETGNV